MGGGFMAGMAGAAAPRINGTAARNNLMLPPGPPQHQVRRVVPQGDLQDRLICTLRSRCCSLAGRPVAGAGRRLGMRGRNPWPYQ